MNAKFPKQLRLPGASEYQKVFDKGRRLRGDVLILLYFANSLPYSRLGLVISNKSAGTVVKRNGIKRQIREFFRLNLSQTAGLDFVLISRKEIAKAGSSEIKQNLEYFQRKLGRPEST